MIKYKHISVCIILLIIYLVFRYNKYNNIPFPIDVVYTWAGESNTNNKRQAYNNELKNSIRSVIKFAPWVNRIYIVVNSSTDVPSWFNDKYTKKITIIEQSKIFPSGSILPNRNSNAIETTIHKIPGLSEHFIYFNDDFFLGKPTKYTDFFTSIGNPYVSSTVLKTESILQNPNLDILKIKYPPFVKQFYPHVPSSLLKSQIIKFQKEYPDYIKWVRSSKIRIANGCAVCTKIKLKCPCAQQHHLIARYMYDNKKAVLKRYNKCNNNRICNTMYINANHINLLNRILVDPPKFFCINDTVENNNKRKRQAVRQKMNNFFEKFYPEVPFFEKQ